MGGAVLTSPLRTPESDCVEVLAYIALDASSNVLGVAQTSGPVGTGPNTRGLGLQKAIGPSITTQPHSATGTYLFTLDEAWTALMGAEVQPTDNTGNALLAYVDANVRANNTGARMGVDPGTNSAIANQSVRVHFRSTTGVLTDPPASSGFWLRLVLKRNTVY